MQFHNADAQALRNVTRHAVDFSLVDQRERTVGAKSVVCDVGGEIEAHHLVRLDDADSENKKQKNKDQ